MGEGTFSNKKRNPSNTGEGEVFLHPEPPDLFRALKHPGFGDPQTPSGCPMEGLGLPLKATGAAALVVLSLGISVFLDPRSPNLGRFRKEPPKSSLRIWDFVPESRKEP